MQRRHARGQGVFYGFALLLAIIAAISAGIVIGATLASMLRGHLPGMPGAQNDWHEEEHFPHG